MTTVRVLAQQLCLQDPDLAIGVVTTLVANTASASRLNVSVLGDAEVAHERVTDEPLAVWLVAQSPTSIAPEIQHVAPPVVVVKRDDCGCLLPVPVRRHELMNLAGIVPALQAQRAGAAVVRAGLRKLSRSDATAGASP